MRTTVPDTHGYYYPRQACLTQWSCFSSRAAILAKRFYRRRFMLLFFALLVPLLGYVILLRWRNLARARAQAESPDEPPRPTGPRRRRHR